MSRNNTGNPLGSKAFLDFEDNVKNLDEAVNSDELSWRDRLGRDRKSFEGMEREFDSAQAYRENEFDSAQTYRESRFNDFIASSGYQFLGDYGPGIEFTEYNQLVRDENGEFWRLSGQVELPYTTTGAGIPEDDALVPAGDAVLRQDLANPDKGAAMVARGVVSVDSIADLLALPEGQRREDLSYLVRGYATIGDGGGGEFYWREGDLSSTLISKTVTSSHVDAATNTITSVAHGLVDGDGITVTVGVNGLVANAVYWVVGATKDTYQISTEPRGTPVNLTGSTNLTAYQLLDPLKMIYVSNSNIGDQGAWVRKSTTGGYIDLAWSGASGLPEVNGGIVEAAGRLAKKLGKYLYSGFDYKIVGTAELRVGYISEGKITVDCSTLPAVRFLEDEVVDRTDLLTTILPYLVQGAVDITGIPDEYEGYTIRIMSSDLLSNRYDPVSPQVYYRRDVNVIGPGGNLQTPLRNTYINPTSLILSKSERAVSKLDVIVVGDGNGYTTTAPAIDIIRSNMILDGTVNNETFPYAPLTVGINVSAAANTQITGRVDGTDRPSLGYAYLLTGTYNITLKDCYSFVTRKAFDMTFAHETKVLGGEFWGEPAAHVAWGLKISGARIYRSGNTQNCITVNGYDIEISDNDIYHGSVINPRYVGIRNDSAVRGGFLRITNNRLYTESNSSQFILDLPITQDYDFGVDISLFEEITVEDNVVSSPNISGLNVRVQAENTKNPFVFPSNISLRRNSVNGRYSGSLNVKHSANNVPPAKTGGTIYTEGVSFLDFAVFSYTERYRVWCSAAVDDDPNEGLKLRIGRVIESVSIRDCDFRYFSFNPDSGDTQTWNQLPLITLTNCTSTEDTTASNLRANYIFRGNNFRKDISLAGDANVQISTGNYGVEQAFALDGVYNNFTHP